MNPLPYKSWTKNPYFISTDPSLISLKTLNEWFATDHCYWTNPIPEPLLQQTIQNSLCFGVYETNDNHDVDFIGFARCVTDHITLLYLTDVIIMPEHQGKGLGKWLISCVREVVEEMPHLRRCVLLTGDWDRSVPFYERLLGAEVNESNRERKEGLAVMMCRGRGNVF